MSNRIAMFDLDGTLTDPQVGITTCIAYALEKLGAEVPARSVLNGWIGAPLKQTFADYLASPARADTALAHYRERFVDKGMFENEPFEGIHEVLEAIRQAADRMLVVTSKPTPFARQIVDHFDMAPFFDEVYGSELDGRFAEKTDLISHVIGSERFAPAAATMIGDRRYDVLAARAHRIRAVGVLWGFGDAEELRAAGADAICAAVPSLPACFAGSDA